MHRSLYDIGSKFPLTADNLHMASQVSSRPQIGNVAAVPELSDQLTFFPAWLHGPVITALAIADTCKGQRDASSLASLYVVM